MLGAWVGVGRCNGQIPGRATGRDPEDSRSWTLQPAPALIGARRWPAAGSPATPSQSRPPELRLPAREGVGGGRVEAASLRRSCPPRGVPSQPAALPSFVPGAGCSSRAPRRPAPLAGTSPDGVPSCLCSSCPLLPAVLPVPSSPRKGVGTAGAAPPRQDVHVQV